MKDQKATTRTLSSISKSKIKNQDPQPSNNDNVISTAITRSLRFVMAAEMTEIAAEYGGHRLHPSASDNHRHRYSYSVLCFAYLPPRYSLALVRSLCSIRSSRRKSKRIGQCMVCTGVAIKYIA
ncbi:uncharacterized protein G2W53_041827 [Senna tora]|uniref:Uncharacterized protein n=1 Tax=Senna tora TaxID=362788 RepID=A0A834W1T9_9FABA|nr:uncharacterized protein G2W53_041827 [Senna tora]